MIIEIATTKLHKCFTLLYSEIAACQTRQLFSLRIIVISKPLERQTKSTGSLTFAESNQRIVRMAAQIWLRSGCQGVNGKRIDVVINIGAWRLSGGVRCLRCGWSLFWLGL